MRFSYIGCEGVKESSESKVINGKMRTPKVYRLERLIDWLNKNHNAGIKKNPVLRGNMRKDNWLSGFIDADGS